ncbi:MAG: SH3 domain-containing protein [Oscillospiraceae bacterium]|jgi:hypothetical protein|nr:SH3 domain-containing protein [Oscillospiraceae bacterium]
MRKLAALFLIALMMAGGIAEAKTTVTAVVAGDEPVYMYNVPRYSGSHQGMASPGDTFEIIEYGPIFSMTMSNLNFIETSSLYFPDGAPESYDEPGSGYAEILLRTQPKKDLMAFVNNPKSGQRLNLRAAPSAKAESYGGYYNGIVLSVLDVKGGWYKVSIDEWMDLGTSYDRVGWMYGDYLSFFIDNAFITPEAPVARVIGKDVALLEEPRNGAASVMRLPKNSLVIVMGVVGEWRHVLVGMERGYVRASALEKTEESPILIQGMTAVPAHGYALVKEDGSDDGKLYELVAVADGWTQIRTSHMHPLQSFVPSEQVTAVYPPEDVGESPVSEANKWTYTGSARILLDRQIPKIAAAVHIQAMEGETPCRYRFTNVKDKETDAPWIELEAGEKAEYHFQLMEFGTYLELENCVLRIWFGNG